MAGRQPAGRSGLSERSGSAGFWGDRERRRALLLSLLIHAIVLLGAVWLYVLPPQETPQLLVLELTPPQNGAPATPAAATGEAAPPADTSQVAGNAAQDAATQSAAVPEVATDATTDPVPVPVNPVNPAELAEAVPPSEQAPPARVPEVAPTPPLPVEPPATTLPEIEAVEVAPQPLQPALELPTPNPEIAVTSERRIAVTPQAEVSLSEPLPTPEVTAELALQAITLPQAQAEVTAENAIPEPDVAVEFAARDVPAPQASAAVSAPQALPQPAATAQIASRPVPQPQAGAVVAQARAVPQPSVRGEVAPGENVPEPQAQVSVSRAQPLAVTPGVTVGDAVSVVTPNAEAVVTAPAATPETDPAAAAGAADAGDGPRNAQTGTAAAADGQGAASDGAGTAPAGVANVQNFEVTLEKPLAVLLDNADAAYPQQGLVEASSVFEMPVEGGLTRLMSVYTKGDPAQVGPIRSARDYFLEAALAMNGTLVHVGGAPSTVGRIASQGLPTLDALQQGDLFAQAPDRAAPHSTFSTGTALRDAVGRLQNSVNGTLYTPPGDAPNAAAVTVNYSADYSSGFRYLPDLDRYRWVRSGAEATDAVQEAVTADAVVVARVVAFPYPDDPEGRLYLPYSGGEATLYLRGKVIPGSWTPKGGFAFVSTTGIEVDLTPFKRWILFAPEAAPVAVQ